MQWTCQLVVKTDAPLTGEVDGPSPGGGVTLFKGGSSPPLRGGWINPWLCSACIRYLTYTSSAVSVRPIAHYSCCVFSGLAIDYWPIYVVAKAK